MEEGKILARRAIQKGFYTAVELGRIRVMNHCQKSSINAYLHILRAEADGTRRSLNSPLLRHRCDMVVSSLLLCYLYCKFKYQIPTN